jgi:hypothetical protein
MRPHEIKTAIYKYNIKKYQRRDINRRQINRLPRIFTILPF